MPRDIVQEIMEGNILMKRKISREATDTPELCQYWGDCPNPNKCPLKNKINYRDEIRNEWEKFGRKSTNLLTMITF